MVDCWYSLDFKRVDVNHWNYRAASDAVKQVFGITPDFTREGSFYCTYN